MRVIHGVMQRCPEVLVRAVRVLRPLQKVLCTLVVRDKVHKVPTEYSVRAAADDFDLVRWWTVSTNSFSYSRRSVFVELLPHLHHITCNTPIPELRAKRFPCRLFQNFYRTMAADAVRYRVDSARVDPRGNCHCSKVLL